MKLTHIRNATLLLEFEHQNQPVGLLIDPMLAGLGALPTLKWFGGRRRRNPLVELPPTAQALLGHVTHALITHCQRGHFDHLDSKGRRFLREHATPVFCMPRDDAFLRGTGLLTQCLDGAKAQAFFGERITPVPCLHGRGIVGKLMEHGHGYFIDLPGEPTVYIAGDTLLTEPVRHALTVLQPDIAVLPAGGARFDLGGDIIMGPTDIGAALQLTSGIIVANHLEALDHCPATRAELLHLAQTMGEHKRLLVPADGQFYIFSTSPRSAISS